MPNRHSSPAVQSVSFRFPVSSGKPVGLLDTAPSRPVMTRGRRMSITSGSTLIQAGLHYSPLIVLECLGVGVVHVWLRDTWGAWSPAHRTVVVASGLSPVQERCVL